MPKKQKSEFSRSTCWVSLKNEARVASLLKKAAGVKDDWDGYGAKRPNEVALGHCANFLLKALNAMDHVTPASVLPSVIGGIGVTYTGGAAEVYVEFYNTGKAFVVLSGKDSSPVVQRLDLEIPGLFDVIRAHLDEAQPE